MFVALFVLTGVASLSGVFSICSDVLRSNALTGTIFKFSTGLVNKGLIISGFKVASGVGCFLVAVWGTLTLCDGSATIIVA